VLPSWARPVAKLPAFSGRLSASPEAQGQAPIAIVAKRRSTPTPSVRPAQPPSQGDPDARTATTPLERDHPPATRPARRQRDQPPHPKRPTPSLQHRESREPPPPIPILGPSGHRQHPLLPPHTHRNLRREPRRMTNPRRPNHPSAPRPNPGRQPRSHHRHSDLSQQPPGPTPVQHLQNRPDQPDGIKGGRRRLRHRHPHRPRPWPRNDINTDRRLVSRQTTNNWGHAQPGEPR
jgi:hypothetical protein